MLWSVPLIYGREKIFSWQKSHNNNKAKHRYTPKLWFSCILDSFTSFRNAIYFFHCSLSNDALRPFPFTCWRCTTGTQKFPLIPSSQAFIPLLLAWYPSTLLSCIIINCFSSVSYRLSFTQYKAKIRSLPRGVLHAKQMVNDSSIMTAFGLVGNNVYGMRNKLIRIHDKLHLFFLENSKNLVVTTVFHDTLDIYTEPET